MDGATLVEWVLRIVLGGGLLASVVKYARERKRNRAAETIADKTVELKIDADRLENLEHRLDFTQKAFDLERASLNNQIRALSAENQRLTAVLEQREAKIAELEDRLASMQAEIQAVAGELAKLRNHDADE